MHQKSTVWIQWKGTHAGGWIAIPHGIWWLPLNAIRDGSSLQLLACLRSDSLYAKIHVGVLARTVLMKWPQEELIREGGKKNRAWKELGKNVSWGETKTVIYSNLTLVQLCPCELKKLAKLFVIASPWWTRACGRWAQAYFRAIIMASVLG